MRLLICAVVLVSMTVSPSGESSEASGDEQPQIAVAREGGGILLIDTNGRRTKILTSHRSWRDWAPAWSPDGQQIAFTRTTDGMQSFRIYVMRADGTGVRRLSRGRFDDHAAWSPDGRWIAYSATDGLRVIRPNGTGARLVVKEPSTTYPSWTPDGRLAYSFHPELPSEQPPSCKPRSARCGWVWTLNLGSGVRRPILRGRDAHWSADGRTIVYTLPDGGIATRGSGRTRRLGKGYLADWAANGQSIVFARLGLTASGDSIWLMSRSGGGRHRIMQGATNPAWRPAQ